MRDFLSHNRAVRLQKVAWEIIRPRGRQQQCRVDSRPLNLTEEGEAQEGEQIGRVDSQEDSRTAGTKKAMGSFEDIRPLTPSLLQEGEWVNKWT